MLNWLWLATALALAGGCVTVPAKDPGIDAGSTNSALNPNGTKFSRFWKRQTDKLDTLAKKPAPNRINTAPPNAEFYLTMAIAQEQASNPDKAEEFYQKALASDPKSLETLTGYAHFEDRRRHLNAATKLYKRALARYPEEAGVYNDLALCYQRQGMLNESVAMLRKATRLQPERPLYHNNLATVLVDAERNDEALTQLLAANPPSVAHYNLGCLLHRKGNDALAVEHFQLALVDDPNMHAAEQWLAKIGPQSPPAQSDPVEQRFAQRRRPLRPMQVELGPSSDASTVHVDDNAGPVTAPPAAPPTAARSIPAQAISRQTVRQRPVSAPVDEIAPPPSSNYAPPPSSDYTAQPAAPPAAEFVPPPSSGYAGEPAAPPVTENVAADPPATESPSAAPPASEHAPPPSSGYVVEPAAPPATENMVADPPATELLPGSSRATEALLSPPPTTELLPNAGQASESLFSPPPASEPLPADVSAATPADQGAGGRPAAGGAIQYPHDPRRTDSPDGFELLPAAPLPDAIQRPARPARPMSQPDEIEPLPALDGAEDPSAV
jgi:Tfp pilus assembly protein PilF